MDEYGKYYYIREPMNAKRDPGDLTAARAIREKNNCKSFKWHATADRQSTCRIKIGAFMGRPEQSGPCN
uniref:Uncharacterized protein n=1 Tax=Plectus sambesii TaxID=2011161 RepID=A0A914VEF3_9BILA